MSNYLATPASGGVFSVFGSQRIYLGTAVMDDGAANPVQTGFNNIDFFVMRANGSNALPSYYTSSGGAITMTTAASASSFSVMILGR